MAKVKALLGPDLVRNGSGWWKRIRDLRRFRGSAYLVRGALDKHGLLEIPGSTELRSPAPGRNDVPNVERVAVPQRPVGRSPVQANQGLLNLQEKPYAFVPLPTEFQSDKPVWHDGSESAGRLSGEIRFEMETLTPLLVGWERQIVGEPDGEGESPTIPYQASGDGAVRLQPPIGPLEVTKTKTLLCPLRAPWGERPVLIPGDSLKGLLRHEIGALLGAPMERVAERSYSYRPNSLTSIQAAAPDYLRGSLAFPRIALRCERSRQSRGRQLFESLSRLNC